MMYWFPVQPILTIRNAGSNKTVTAGSFTLSGADKANYSLTTQSANTTGSISRKALMITADDKERFCRNSKPCIYGELFRFRE
jgi:hypothetical protein